MKDNFAHCVVVQEFVLHLRHEKSFAMNTTTISDFRINIKKFVDSVINDNSALLINRGNTGAVLISLDEYNSIVATERILFNEKLEAAVSNAIAEEAAGKCIKIDFDQL